MPNNIKQQYKHSMETLTQKAKEELRERGVRLRDIADIVYDLQSPYIKDLSIEFCEYSVKKVLEKREVVNAVLTGIQIDKLAEKDLIEEPILSVIKSDEGLYGIDEILPLSIINLYGSIGLTNFGFLDKEKTGIIKELDIAKTGAVNTFLDDIVAAIAAAAASRIAHSTREPNKKSYE
ncbi:phosphatidylglycerophosphatase A family protein [Helcococcus kunzii]|uniref:YutG/PgpA domain-containing protein n=1 Tax=Helcococcus kunzii ATCC 51366 TaxID=883114 RepID=H3NLM5_9FIRM|nr:phosphatidylglycerophosphatase A [Helcococcus kunzii]EHR35790.1 hypothetical protein HMPREF9709_00236 [Helcococcus kunzii ATCC 51366]MCT1796307.1 phosphatidylglycerophosphatase A [Helcococcus kunzii]MCT1988977.1 phosphatidylglycerophosphatase A [Helcococcus kunzii]QUY64167.1 phosphatidylglycerophosphatase A [Helcococcus kunzii]QZO76623.1 phosphatidylglycerophosphatase A [Helcococcus kunzii]